MFAAKNSFLTAGAGGALYMDASASGATVNTSGNYKIAIFNGTGSFTVTSTGTDPTEGSAVEYLVVAGGGGAGKSGTYPSNIIPSAGGGAGGMRSGTGQAVTAISYTITVGAGGPGASSTAAGTDGDASSFGSLIATVGGGGSFNGGVGRNGGSGAGGNSNNMAFYSSEQPDCADRFDLDHLE